MEPARAPRGRPKTRKRREGRTLAAQLGFADPDIQTPGHDVLVAHVAALIPTLFEQRTQGMSWNQEKIDWALSLHPEATPAPAPPAVWRIGGVEWERPILRNMPDPWETSRRRVNKNIVGFADLGVDLLKPRGVHIKEGKWVVEYDHVEWLFEVKPDIPSLGELFRQLNLYRLHNPWARYWVASPDAGHRETIEEQGWRFLEITESGMLLVEGKHDRLEIR